jgi:hypothetical protein
MQCRGDIFIFCIICFSQWNYMGHNMIIKQLQHNVLEITKYSDVIQAIMRRRDAERNFLGTPAPRSEIHIWNVLSESRNALDSCSPNCWQIWMTILINFLRGCVGKCHAYSQKAGFKCSWTSLQRARVITKSRLFTLLHLRFRRQVERHNKLWLIFKFNQDLAIS